MSTGIQWTDETWNPIRARRTWPDGESLRGWHCERVSPGCENCYAETLNEKRFGTGLGYTRPSRDMVSIYLDERTLSQPLHWRKPRRVFVCSMTDLFGEWVTDEMLDRVFAVMALTPHITYQVLTKRPEQALAYLTQPDVVGDVEGEADALAGAFGWHHSGDWSWPLPNVWLGVSVEDQRRADERIPVLMDTPAAVRFLSCEPLLGAVDLSHWVGCEICGKALPCDCGFHEEPALDWVIVGGESGAGARPCDLAWVRSIVSQCQTAGTAVFVKQLGAKPCEAHERWSDDRGSMVTSYPDVQWVKLRDRHGANMSEWPEDLREREFPRCP